MLWAHISHLFYDDARQSTSVGEILHSLLGLRLYTLATFALGGGTMMLFDDTKDNIGYAFVRGIAPVPGCKPACFVDMRGTAGPLVLRPQPVWFEFKCRSVRTSMAPCGWSTIHAPDMPLGKLLVLSGIHYQRQLVGGRLIILLALILSVGWLVRRWVLRRRSSVFVG